jgi:hypothetical protein
MPFLSHAVPFNKQLTAAIALCASYAVAKGLLYNALANRRSGQEQRNEVRTNAPNVKCRYVQNVGWGVF